MKRRNRKRGCLVFTMLTTILLAGQTMLPMAGEMGGFDIDIAPGAGGGEAWWENSGGNQESGENELYEWGEQSDYTGGSVAEVGDDPPQDYGGWEEEYRAAYSDDVNYGDEDADRKGIAGNAAEDNFGLIPVRDAESPAQGVESSVQGAESPAQGAKSSVQGAETPVQGAKSSVQGAETSVQNAEFPAQGAKSSPQDADPLAQDVEALTQSPISPTQSPAPQTAGNSVLSSALSTVPALLPAKNRFLYYNDDDISEKKKENKNYKADFQHAKITSEGEFPQIEVKTGCALAVLSLRLNGRECPWHWEENRIVLGNKIKGKNNRIELVAVLDGACVTEMDPWIF